MGEAERELFAAIGIGRSVGFGRTVSESDVALFAGISGDFAPNHVDDAFMRRAGFAGRIAHGALLVAYSSRASTMMAEACMAEHPGWVALAQGFDRVRFLKPVPIGTNLRIGYRITEVDAERARTMATIEIHDEAGDLVMVAAHLIRWVRAAG